MSNSLNTSTLRPGLLVSLSTSIRGNVRYDKRVITPETKTEDGVQKATWETTRIIVDAEEYERAKKARAEAGHAIRRICATSAFGLLCPEADAEELAKGINEARRICDAFNDSATLTRIGVYVITGRIAPDDVEAVKAINSEVRGLMDAMEEGIKNLDVKVIRDAASKARQIGSMLTPDAQARIALAIETARNAAKKIVSAGEAAAVEVDTKALRTLKEQRVAFLDLDEAGEVQAPTVQGRAVDFTPTDTIKAPAPKAAAVEL